MKKNIILFLFIGMLSNVLGQDLNSYIQEALKKNPEIQSFELKYKRFEEKVNESHSLANTQISAGYFVSEPETRTGPQRFKISVKQMFPWFGTFTARENYAKANADVEFQNMAIAKRKLAMSVAQSYYNLFAIRAKQRILKEQMNLLETYETLALTAVKTNQSSVVEVLKLQIRQNELDEKFQLLQQDFLAEQSVFNHLRNIDSKAEIVVPDSLNFSTDIHFTNEKLSLHPELVKYDKLYKSVSEAERLNQKEKNPQIGFGVDYVNVSKRPKLNISDNGKDILMPMVSLTIPLFNKSYQSKTKQNQLLEEEIKAQQQNRRNSLEAMLDKALKAQESAIISYQILKKNLAQAKNAETILLKNYETGTLDFDEILNIQELQLKFQINQIEALYKYFKQQAIINYLTN